MTLPGQSLSGDESTRILESITDAFFSVDGEWHFLYVNRAAERLLRQTREALLGRVLWEVFPEAIGTEFDEQYHRAYAGQVTVRFEAYYAPYDTWFLVHAYPSPHGLSVYFSDISDRKRAEARLAAAEAHYRRLVTTTPHAVYAVDTAGRFVELNPAAERMLGRSADTLLGHTFERVLSAEQIPKSRDLFQRLVTGEADDLEVETRVCTAAGDERLVRLTITAIRERDQVVGWHGIARDITDERAAETALRESEARFRRIAEQVGEVFWEATPDFSETRYMSPLFEQVWGEPVARAYEEPRWFLEAILAEDMPRVRAALASIGAGNPGQAEYRIRRRDGQVRWMLSRAHAVTDQEGRVTGVAGTSLDITERRTLEARQRLLATIFDGLDEGLCVLSTAGTVLYANQTFAALAGIPAAAIPGFDPRSLAALSDAARQFPDMLQAALDTGRWSGRVVHRHPSDGREVPIDITLSRVRLEDGDSLLFAIVQDATEDIAREERQRRTERLASMGTLAAGVAHELNNPLQAILSFTQLLRMNASRPQEVESLAIMQREAERMAKIVSDLKQVARATQDEEARRGPVDLNDVIRHVCRAQEYRLRTGNVDVTFDLADVLPPVLADAAQAEQVVLNLVVNACQAMASWHGEGRLVLHTEAASGGVVLHVVDDGPGIESSHLDRIFDPFFTTKGPGEGTGLGLAVVHRVVTDHGGDIGVESAPGLGTRVRIWWPAAEPGAVPAMEAPPAGQTSPRSRRVLIVDDEAAIRLVLGQYLGQRGHTVDAAADGHGALRLLDAGAYDVILSDLRMPGLGGEALVARIRERGHGGRVVLMTGDPASAGALANASDVRLLLKPMTLEAVAAIVEGTDNARR
ncbi:PAS domain S-box protein [Luteitalea sp.]|uniref:PAS domain S-box protein n=1 Tax=Luteitalea sp. TaxID=2004800 RepID=UPI0037C73394